MSLLYKVFPKLEHDLSFEILSEHDMYYNCIGYSLGFVDYWVWPVYSGGFLIQNRRNCTKQIKQFWPIGVNKDLTLNSFLRVYEIFGYELCTDDNIEYEPEYEKVLIYGTSEDNVTHAATVHNGYCISKLGSEELIKHNAKSITGKAYGEILVAVRRRLNTNISDRATLMDNGGEIKTKIIRDLDL